MTGQTKPGRCPVFLCLAVGGPHFSSKTAKNLRRRSSGLAFNPRSPGYGGLMKPQQAQRPPDLHRAAPRMATFDGQGRARLRNTSKGTPMTHGRHYIAAVLLGAISLGAGAVTAQQQRPPKPDFSAVATALNVPEQAFVGCLGERPERGERLERGQSSERSERPARPDAAKISACLDDAGYTVSAGAVDQAFEAAAPRRR